MNEFKATVVCQINEDIPIMTKHELVVSSETGDKKDAENFIKGLYYKVFSIKVRILKSAVFKNKINSKKNGKELSNFHKEE